MTIRILANREPYSSYAEASRPDDTNDPSGPFIFLNGPAGLDDPSPDIIVIPAEDFLVLRPVYSADRGKGTIYVAYGSVALMERAFDSGCADYIREPWALPELRARIGRLFGQKFRIGERAVELGRRLLSGKTAAIELSENESRLLRILLLNAPLPVPRNAAFAALSSSAREERHALSRCVISLRRKMDTVEPGLGARLRAVRGFGYRMMVDICG